MPGLNILHSLSPFTPELSARFEKATDGGRCLPDYVSEKLHQSEYLRVDACRYPEYPVRTFQTPLATYIFEGRLYGPSDEEKTLTALEPLLFDPSQNEKLHDWLLDTDGDFLLVAKRKDNGETVIMNDLLGRLPVYLYAGKEGFAASRDISFLRRFFGFQTLDRIGMAQFLLLGYPVGGRTLYRNVHKFECGTLLRLSPETGVPVFENLHSFAFDIYSAGRWSVAENARDLAEVFRQTLRRQTASNPKAVLSLSGGLDSRCVAGGLVGQKFQIPARSFEDEGGRADADSQVAEKLAQALALDWKKFKTPLACGKDLTQLLSVKGGQNTLGMSFLLPFLTEIRAEFGPGVWLFTGDGGDKTMPTLRAPKHLDNLDALLRFVVDKHSLMTLDMAARLSEVAREELVASLREVLSSYPESSADDRYVRFLVYERAFQWLFEGEDRNRAFCWSLSPFYGQKFFRRAMQVPPEQKKDYELYRWFLEEISETAAAVIDANIGESIQSGRYRLKRKFISTVTRFPSLTKILKKTLRPEKHYNTESAPMKLLREQLKASKILGDILDREALQHVLAEPEILSKESVGNLLTLTSLADRLQGKTETLASFADTRFF